jgi:hypothetical protein
MGGTIKSGNAAHDAACYLAENLRQSAVIGATNNAAGQTEVNNAEVAYNRAVIASCKTNLGGAGQEAFINALKALGTGGT